MRSLILCTLIAGAFAVPAIAATHTSSRARPIPAKPAVTSIHKAQPATTVATHKKHKHHKHQAQKSAPNADD